MFTIEYEQSLVETAVFLAVRSDEQLECELHQSIDPLYEITDMELRQREFVPVFREFFKKLGFDRLMVGLLAQRPLIGELVDTCVTREAPRIKAESAELLIQTDRNVGEKSSSLSGRTLVIQICPQSFIDSKRFVPLMHRELMHVVDMLDERFGYVRETFAGDPSKQNLQRDRYRVLWDTYVEGRLEREGLGIPGEKQRLERAFGRVFVNGPAGADPLVFASVFDATSMTHSSFMEWVNEPSLLSEPRTSVRADLSQSGVLGN